MYNFSMVVYVEYVLLDNFIIDAMLVTLSRKGLKLTVKRLNVFLSALIGALFATFFPLLRLKAVLGFLTKLPIGMLIIACSGKFGNVRQYFRCSCLFLLFTFAFGGCVTAVFWGLGLSFDPVNYSHGGEIPLFAILVIVIVAYKICEKSIKSVYKRKRIANFTVKCAFQIGGRYFVKLAFLDSGNCLTYNKTNSPIAVCSTKLTKELEKEGVLNLAYVADVKVNTVSGESVLPIYKLEKFLIYNLEKPNIINNVMLATANGKVSISEEFDLIIGPIIYEVA